MCANFFQCPFPPLPRSSDSPTYDRYVTSQPPICLLILKSIPIPPFPFTGAAPPRPGHVFSLILPFISFTDSLCFPASPPSPIYEIYIWK